MKYPTQQTRKKHTVKIKKSKKHRLAFGGINPIIRDKDGQIKVSIGNCDDIIGKPKERKRKYIDTNGTTMQWNHDGFRCHVLGTTGFGKTNHIMFLITSGIIIANRIIVFASPSSLKQEKYYELPKYFKKTKYHPELIITSDQDEVPNVEDNPPMTLLLKDDQDLSKLGATHILDYYTQGRNQGCSAVNMTQVTMVNSNSKVANTKNAFYGNATHFILHYCSTYKKQIQHLMQTISVGLTVKEFIEVYERFFSANNNKYAFIIIDLNAREPPMEIAEKERRILDAIFGFSFNSLRIRFGWDNQPWVFGTTDSIIKKHLKRKRESNRQKTKEEIDEENEASEDEVSDNEAPPVKQYKATPEKGEKLIL